MGAVLIEREVGGEAEEEGVREIFDGTEVVEGVEGDALAAEGVDGFGLLVTQVRMALQTR